MENRLSKILIALALGGVAVWLVFRVKQAYAAEKPPVAPTIVIPEVKKPKWEVTSTQVVYRSDSIEFRLPVPDWLGGLFKRQDQLALETLQAQTQK